MRLFAFYRSSASYRVRIALAHKRIPYELVPVSLARGETSGPEHLARNPLGQVPVLEVHEGGRRTQLAQSLAILEYLEEAHPQPALLPAGALERARARELAELVNSGIQPLQNTPVLARVEHELGGDPQAWAAHFMRKGLLALEQRVRARAGAFLVGDAPSFADVCLVPQLYNARRFGVSLEGLDTLLAVDARCAELPGWSDAHPDRQPDAPPA